MLISGAKVKNLNILQEGKGFKSSYLQPMRHLTRLGYVVTCVNHSLDKNNKIILLIVLLLFTLLYILSVLFYECNIAFLEQVSFRGFDEHMAFGGGKREGVICRYYIGSFAIFTFFCLVMKIW